MTQQIDHGLDVEKTEFTVGDLDLYPGVADPQMDSMRILSETAMAFPNALSFSSGAPFDGEYDLQQINLHIERYIQKLREDGVSEAAITRRMFHYGPVNGFILTEVSRMLSGFENINAPAAAIMITNGFQEALLVALRGVMRTPEDVLLVVAPAYVGALGAAKMLGVPVHGIPEGPDGLTAQAVTDAVAEVRASGRNPRALYLIPDFSNPSGTVIPVRARLDLLKVASKNNLLILEDNPYGIFAADGQDEPTMKSLDVERRVIYLGSFAKSAFPGARLGFLVADQLIQAKEGKERYLAEELSTAKAMFSVGTSSLSQALIAGLLVSNNYDLRTATTSIREVYLKRLRTALGALNKHFPSGGEGKNVVSWNTPKGGFFVVLEVPFEADLEAMERSARDFGVSWAPMRMFFTDGGGERAMRLGISNLTPSLIEEGIGRLANFIEHEQTLQAGKQ